MKKMETAQLARQYEQNHEYTHAISQWRKLKRQFKNPINKDYAAKRLNFCKQAVIRQEQQTT